MKANSDEVLAFYEGIPCQSVTEAIRSAGRTMMRDRLREAAMAVRREGYITPDEFERLTEEMDW